MTLTQIIISRAILCLFQHASRQSHHYNHLKMGKIPPTPQTSSPHARTHCGAAFRLYDFKSHD